MKKNIISKLFLSTIIIVMGFINNVYGIYAGEPEPTIEAKTIIICSIIIVILLLGVLVTYLKSKRKKF